MSSKDLNIIPQFESADLEEFNRPNHNDFLTSGELKQKKFSGVRINSLTDSQELWILGEILLNMSKAEMQLNLKAWDRRYAEVLGLHEVETVAQKGN